MAVEGGGGGSGEPPYLLTEPFGRLVVLECAVRAVAEQRVELGRRELAVEVAVAALLRLDAIEHRLVQTDAEGVRMWE